MSRSRRQPYRKARAVDTSCRSHGGCPWCTGDRLHKHAVRTVETPEQLASDESFAQIGREVDAVRLAEDARYAMPDAFFAIFGMVRVSGDE